MRSNLRLAAFIFFIQFFSLHLSGETLLSLCYLTDKPNGKDLFNLKAHTRVACGLVDKGQVQVLFKAFIRTKDVYDGIRILAGARFYDQSGKEQGRALADMLPYRTIEENDSGFTMEVAGYARASCIDPASVVENDLRRLFQANVLSYPLDSFKTHIARFGYLPWLKNKQFISYVLMETDIVKARPGIRVVLVFEGDRAVAVFHDRGLKFERFESVAITSKYSLVYLGSFDESFKKQISDLMIPTIDALY